jgi:hypothetical protein
MSIDAKVVLHVYLLIGNLSIDDETDSDDRIPLEIPLSMKTGQLF